MIEIARSSASPEEIAAIVYALRVLESHGETPHPEFPRGRRRELSDEWEALRLRRRAARRRAARRP